MAKTTSFKITDKVKFAGGEEGEIVGVPTDLRKPFMVRKPGGETVLLRARQIQKLDAGAASGPAPDDLAVRFTGNDVVVVASNPTELEAGQKHLIASVRAKEVQQQEEVRAAEETFAIAEAAGISVEPAKRMLARAKGRVLYLSKIAAALEAGYVMVPNFPGSTIAIRVTRDRPRARAGESTNRQWANPNREQPDRSPAGEGRFVSPKAEVDVDTEKTDEGKTRYIVTPTELQEEIALPGEFLKPMVVKRLEQAMADKIFDEIIVTPGRRERRRGDPMVLGRVLARRRDYPNDSPRMLTFLIAWFQDTAVI